MGFCDSMIKCILIVINVVFVIAGLAILSVGVIAYQKYQDFSQIFSSTIASPPIIMMVIGSVIFVVAFYGCCGAAMDSSCMLTTYGILLILICVAEVVVGIVALVNGKDVFDVFHKILQKEFNNTGSDQAAFDLFVALQSQLKCCGVDGPSDYLARPNPKLYASCTYDSSIISAPYNVGCTTKLTSLIDDNATIIGGAAIGIAVLEIVGAIVGFVLAKQSQ